MRFPIKSTVAVAIVGLAGLAAFASLGAPWSGQKGPKHLQAKVTTIAVVSAINATGTVQPVKKVSVGAAVSGQIKELYVNFNDEVKKGQLLATIDPQIYEANVARDKACLATKKAEQKRMGASLEQAANDLARAKALQQENKDFISDSEMDQFKFKHRSAEAQLEETKKSVESAQASLASSEANLEYTKITSPVDGIIIGGQMCQGQTVAAQYQTPDLFVIAADLRTQVHIVASVDEAHIGLIREAQRRQQPVSFTVDAYRTRCSRARFSRFV